MYLKNELVEIFNGDNYSKIISVDKYARVGCSAYVEVKRLAERAKSELPINFYDVISCTEIAMDDDTTNEVVDNIVKLINSGNHFMPIIEVAREYSNLVFIAETNIPYVGNAYKFPDEDGICEFIKSVCKKIYKKMSIKTPLTVCMYIRCYKKKVYFKLHFLEYVMDISNRVALMKTIIKKLTSDETFKAVYPIRFNEFSETSTLPLMQSSKEHFFWQLFRTFKCNKNYGVTVTNITKDEFKERYPPLMLSINNYTGKELFHRDVPSYSIDNVSFNEDVSLLYEINKSTRIAFLDLVLRHLPIEYKQGKHMENIIMSLKCVNDSKLLVKYHFKNNYPQDSPLDCEEAFNKIWNRNNKISLFGYYANIARDDATFKSNFREFLLNEIEKAFYTYGGKISDAKLSQLLDCCFYGRYYSFEVMRKGGNPIMRIYEYVDEYIEANNDLLYKWHEVGNSSVIGRFISNDMHEYFRAVFERLKSLGANSRSKDEKLNAMGKMMTKFENSTNKLADSTGVAHIYDFYKKYEISCGLFFTRINADKSVIGVKNGILDLDLYSDDPKPRLYKGYSPYVVTKSADAKWIPYEKLKQKAKYLPRIKQVFRDNIPEDDARFKYKCLLSTSFDEVAIKDIILIDLGFGSNGKSTNSDWHLAVTGNYGTKLSSTLITEGRKGSAADPEFMKIFGHRFGLIAETNKKDKLVAGRLKSITERVKDGRGLFEDCSNFDANPTVIINSNYPLPSEDTDFGTTRRIMVYYRKVRYVYNPDVNDPHERKIDPSVSNLLLINEEARNEYFSWMVHIRCKFQRLYGGNIHKVPSQTIDDYTNDYRCEQDNISKFIHRKLVIMKGYKADGKLREGETAEAITEYYANNEIMFVERLSMESVVREYIEWNKVNNGIVVTDGYNGVFNTFKTSRLSKRIVGDGETAYLKGIRILERGKSKLEEESHYN